MSSASKHLDPQSLAPQPTTSQRFQASDADVIFQSSDNVRFHIHRKNLETHTGAFPPAEIETHGEIVTLTEDVSTLDNLFQYVYPQRQPDLELLSVDELYKLAEAAEKYEVFNVMAMCKARIKQLASDNPGIAFNYASNHDHQDIMSIAAPLLLDVPLDELVVTLLPRFVIPWVRYREYWNRVAWKAVNAQLTFPNEVYHGSLCDGYLPTNASKLWMALGDKRSRKAIFELVRNFDIPGRCPRCNHCIDGVNLKVAILAATELFVSRALDAVPEFETFL
ncbi:hypothetical protein DXG01_005319 [Tephrocybe rancida]|nr:hypothetical protein DXG01_005319 [Tephrocybe rancida]